MLVLTRKMGESILIGDEVRVKVLKATGSRVQLGIEAPELLRIVREKRENLRHELAPAPETVAVPVWSPPS